MRKSRYAMSAMSFLLAAAMNTARADESGGSPFSVTLETELRSGYAWRGMVVSDEGVVQPALVLANGGFRMGVWGNMNLTDDKTGDAPDFSELDIKLSYNKIIGEVEFGLGFTELTYPNRRVSATREVWASLALPNLVVVPALAVNYDFNEAEGMYSTVSATYVHKLHGDVTLSTIASLAYATEEYNLCYFGVEEGAFNDLTAGANLEYELAYNIKIAGMLQYSILLDGDVRDGARARYDATHPASAGIKLSFTF